MDEYSLMMMLRLPQKFSMNVQGPAFDIDCSEDTVIEYSSTGHYTDNIGRVAIQLEEIHNNTSNSVLVFRSSNVELTTYVDSTTPHACSISNESMRRMIIDCNRTSLVSDNLVIMINKNNSIKLTDLISTYRLFITSNAFIQVTKQSNNFTIQTFGVQDTSTSRSIVQLLSSVLLRDMPECISVRIGNSAPTASLIQQAIVASIPISVSIRQLRPNLELPTMLSNDVSLILGYNSQVEVAVIESVTYLRFIGGAIEKYNAECYDARPRTRKIGIRESTIVINGRVCPLRETICDVVNATQWIEYDIPIKVNNSVGVVDGVLFAFNLNGQVRM